MERKKVEILLANHLPTKAGCWVKANKCPNNDAAYKKEYGEYNKWVPDGWGMANKNAKADAKACENRLVDFKNWCGIDNFDVSMHHSK